jgi:SET domain-containing protein
MNVDIRQSDIHGLGVFARELIKEGDWQYIYGMIVPSLSQYSFEYGNAWWEPFPPFRYTNHSNTPNCEITLWDDGTASIQALRCIHSDEELTINYGYDPAEEYDNN